MQHLSSLQEPLDKKTNITDNRIIAVYMICVQDLLGSVVGRPGADLPVLQEVGNDAQGV